MPHPARDVTGADRRVNRSCSVCGGALRTPQRSGVEQAIGPVRALAETRAFTVCDAHVSAQSALRAAVLAAVDGRLPLALHRRGGACCGPCGAVLDLPMRATTRSVTVEPPDGDPFTVTLALPLIRCGECGTDNVPAELRASLHECMLSVVNVDDPGRARSRLLSWLRRHDGP